jgi:hypothetical protein
MGHYKGEGICWAGNCTNPAEPTGATDSLGQPFQLCPQCQEHWAKELKRHALKIVGLELQ